VNYEVMCVCGQLLRGERQRHHQVVSCANCGRKQFVLPRSPLDTIDEPPPAAPPPRSWLRSWAAPLLVGAGALGLLLVGFLVAWPFLRKPENNVTTEESPEHLLSKIDAGQHLLAQGKFQLAHRALDEAVRERNRQPKLLMPAENRRLNQLQRQADLLVRLSLVSLEQIVDTARTTGDAMEWGLYFGEHHRGRSVVFDDEVRRDPQGRLILRNYAVEVNGDVVRLALDDLTLLRDLVEEGSPRLIFGARLANCEREEGGGWVIHFAPQSGVLFTDADAVSAASSTSLDPGLKATIQRQQRWLDEHPGEPLNR
jgi:hypothetical protein